MQIPDDFPTPHAHSAVPAKIQMVCGGFDEPLDRRAHVQQVYLRFPPEPVLSAGGHVLTQPEQLQPDCLVNPPLTPLPQPLLAPLRPSSLSISLQTQKCADPDDYGSVDTNLTILPMLILTLRCHRLCCDPCLSR